MNNLNENYPMDYSALKWHNWFAWYPKRTISKKWIWLKTVHRRFPNFYYFFHWDSYPRAIYGNSIIKEINEN